LQLSGQFGGDEMVDCGYAGKGEKFGGYGGFVCSDYYAGGEMALLKTSKANGLIAYDFIRCGGHPCCDTHDKDLGHGPNFQSIAAIATALNLRTREELGFEVLGAGASKSSYRDLIESGGGEVVFSFRLST
jgi:hypothetical protein